MVARASAAAAISQNASGMAAYPGAWLFRPSGHCCEQEGHHDGAGIAPNHFVDVPEIIGQRGRALIAEASHQDGKHAVEGAPSGQKGRKAMPNGMVLGKQIHDVSILILRVRVKQGRLPEKQRQAFRYS